VGVFNWNGQFPYDPTAFRDYGAYVVYQCCLLRTLLSHTGRPVAQGGAELRPDLASGEPEVSVDGLTWTFRIRRGLRYAPPLQDTEIVAQDVIRSVERALSPAPELDRPSLYLGSGANYFLSVIQGAGDYAKGEADTISGLEAPDPHTLRVRLTHQAGDLPYLFSLQPTSPIPPNPFDPSARFGVAQGHEVDGYGRFLVSSGPYMIEGSEKLDFAKPPDQQQPVSGLDPLVLVRNPSWERSSDPLRLAFPDRIELSSFTHPASPDELFALDPQLNDAYKVAYTKKIEAGDIDVLADFSPPNQEVQRYAADPTLKERLTFNEYGTVKFLSLNVALPPFDDVHVRRAVNEVIGKKRMFEAWQAGFNWAVVTDHLAPDSTEDNLLANYHPYPSAGGTGNLAVAQQEMRLSAYDQDGDGKCDRPVCRRVVVWWRNDGSHPALARLVAEDLLKIGIALDVRLVSSNEMYTRCANPATHATLCQVGWAADYPSASTFFPPLYSSAALATGNNYSVVGASLRQLKRWHYEIESVPNVDDRMEECERATGLRQVQCWVEFDQYLVEKIVPAVPLFADVAPRTFSERVAGFSWDGAIGAPALGQIALRPGSS
jgi:peptide/nickel transport system substrate-binding protein